MQFPKITSNRKAIHNIIIDTDVGADDACTIAFALADTDNVNVAAITTVFGNVSCRQSILNVYALVNMFGNRDVKIFAGASKPLAHAHNASWAGHGIRGMGRWPEPEEDVHGAIKFYEKVSRLQRIVNNNNNNNDNDNDNNNNTDDNNNNNKSPFLYLDKYQQPLSLEGSLVGLNYDLLQHPKLRPNLATLLHTAKSRNHIIPQSLSSFHNVIVKNENNDKFNQLNDDIIIQNMIKYEHNVEYIAAIELVKMVNTHHNHYELLALGPLTNIAFALQIDASFLHKLKRFVWLGGGLVGNTTPYAEFNAYSDSEAVKIVFDALANVKTIPREEWDDVIFEEGQDHHQIKSKCDENILNQNKNHHDDNNDNKTNHSSSLEAFAVGWDACVSGLFDLQMYERLFVTAPQFSWASLHHRIDGILELKDEEIRVMFEKGVKNAAVHQQLSGTLYEGQQYHNIRGFLQDNEEIFPEYKYLTSYVCYQFMSNYEFLVRESHRKYNEAIIQWQKQREKKQDQHNNEYDDDDGGNTKQNENDPTQEIIQEDETDSDDDLEQRDQEVKKRDSKNLNNAEYVAIDDYFGASSPFLTDSEDDSVNDPAAKITQPTSKNKKTKKTTTTTPATALVSSILRAEPKLADFAPFSFVICDLYALFALVYPEVITSDTKAVFMTVSDLKSPYNGQIYPAGTKEDEHIDNLDQKNPLQYILSIDIDQIDTLISTFAHSLRNDLE